MSLGTFVAGRYTAAWNSVAIGLCTEGYEVQMEPKEAMINRSDAFGDTMIDTIHRGADWFCQFEAMESWTASIKSIVSPYATFGLLGVIGQLGSAVCFPLVLTSTAGTPAATSPSTFTATLAKLASNSNPRWQFNSVLRTCPIRMQLYPYSNTGTITFFALT